MEKSLNSLEKNALRRLLNKMTLFELLETLKPILKEITIGTDLKQIDVCLEALELDTQLWDRSY